MAHENTAIILSANRALLGAVFPQLRGVLVSGKNNKWRAYFYFDGEISDDDLESISIAATEIVSDSPYETAWEEKFERLDAPAKISVPEGFDWAYQRKEPPQP